MNIQGMKPSKNSKGGWKLPKIREMIEDLNEKKQSVPFIALCETWLKPEVTDAEVQIDQYEIFRSDRTQRLRGGVAIYAHKCRSMILKVLMTDL